MEWGKLFMASKNGKVNIGNLLIKIHKRLWLSIVVFSLSIISIFVILVIEIKGYLNSNKNPLLIFIYVLILLLLIVMSIIDIKPYYKDLKYFKKYSYNSITGKVIKYRRVVHSGDPDTIDYYPTIVDTNNESVQVELKVKKTELNKTYHCVYLPNTKLAICEEVQNLNKT